MELTKDLPVIDRRARTSDGKAECYNCKRTLPEGEDYVQISNSDSGVLCERSICLKCLDRDDRRDQIAVVAVVVIAVCMVLALAWALSG